MVNERIRNLAKNFKEFYNKAKPVLKKDLVKAGKSAYKMSKSVDRTTDKSLSKINNLINKQLNKKITSRNILKNNKVTLKVPEYKAVNTFTEGSYFFSDDWESETTEDNLLYSNNKIFWA